MTIPERLQEILEQDSADSGYSMPKPLKSQLQSAIAKEYVKMNYKVKYGKTPYHTNQKPKQHTTWIGEIYKQLTGGTRGTTMPANPLDVTTVHEQGTESTSLQVFALFAERLMKTGYISESSVSTGNDTPHREKITLKWSEKGNDLLIRLLNEYAREELIDEYINTEE